MGHLFVAQGDLTKLACDAVLIPCDSRLNVNRSWASILPAGLRPGDGDWLRLPGIGDASGVVTLDDNDGRRVRAFVAIDGPATPDDVVRRLWAAIEHVAEGLPSKDGRARPLIGVPLPGTGDGGLKGRRGEVIDAMLQWHRASDREYDVALALKDVRDFAAIQNRRDPAADWPDLDGPLLEEADRLGGLARRGELSLFIGAGVSMPAGLPDWNELLQGLAGAAEIPVPDGVSPEEAATEIRAALGDGYHQALVDLLEAPRHAVGHALMASLRVPRMVTTNFDPCLELALDSVLGQGYRVLAREFAGNGLPWLLKLNGDVRVPDSIVLTKLDFDQHELESRALQGVVQSLLLTSHLLFVGYSLREKSFLALADEVTRVRRRALCQETSPTGTAIALTDGAGTSTGYSDLRWLSMDKSSATEGARRLEVFLDRLCWKAASSDDWATRYLLDEDYASGLNDNERALRDALHEFLSNVGVEARTSPGWSRMAAALRSLGADLDGLGSIGTAPGSVDS